MLSRLRDAPIVRQQAFTVLVRYIGNLPHAALTDRPNVDLAWFAAHRQIDANEGGASLAAGSGRNLDQCHGLAG